MNFIFISVHSLIQVCLRILNFRKQIAGVDLLWFRLRLIIFIHFFSIFLHIQNLFILMNYNRTPNIASPSMDCGASGDLSLGNINSPMYMIYVYIGLPLAPNFLHSFRRRRNFR